MRPPLRRANPVGQITRGKTALNRLRQVDTFIAAVYTQVLTTDSPLIVDVGYGAQAWTALEMLDRWSGLNPRLRLLGLEIDPMRVAAAQPYADPARITFALGGFNIADHTGTDAVTIIRAYNVLRQYDENAVPAALREMARALQPGGLLIEGTSNPTGRLVAFDVYHKQGESLQHGALIFGTNFRAPLEPADFQAILPKRLIHHMRDPRPMAFFGAWTHAFALARGQGQTGTRHVWVRAGEILRNVLGIPVDPRGRLLRRGFLMLHDDLGKNAV